MNTADTDLAVITGKVAALDGTTDFIVTTNTIGLIADMAGRLRELKQEAEDAAVKYIQANGDQTIGEVRYYVGTVKTYKPRNMIVAVESILDASCGDVDRLADCMSSSAIKAGETRKLFKEAGKPDRFDEVFETIESAKLEEGRPKLQKFNKAFVR